MSHTRLQFISIIALFFLTPSGVYAATLQITPSQTTVSVGSTFTETISVSSGNQALNAISGSLTFPTDLLQVVSLSKANSVLTLWVQEPTFSNAQGTISFGGIVPDPGFAGDGGRVLSVQFRAKKSGTANVSFTSASQVLANDGNGTNILTSGGGGSATIAVANPVTVTPAEGTITITSPTHPNPNAWYSSTQVELQWKNSSNATNIRIGYDKEPRGQPTVLYDASVTEKSLKLSEGVWYFHVQEQTSSGWSAVSTFRIQIDTTPPLSLRIQFPDGPTFNNSQPVAVFKTTDELSGLNHYILTLEKGSPLRIDAGAVTESPYPLPVAGPGQNSVKVTAYDKAGNSVTSQANFTVIGLNPPLIDPIADIVSGKKLEITGSTYPNVQIELLLKNEVGQASSQISQTDLGGVFRMIWKDDLFVGVYTIAGQVTDSTGAKSTLSPEITFQVKKSIFSTIVQFVVNYVSIGIIIALLFIALLFVLRYVWHHLHSLHIRLRQRINSERIGHTHTVLHQQFTELKDAIEEEIEALQHIKAKRDLTLEEKRFVARFQKMLDKAEVAIDEEIDAIAK